MTISENSEPNIRDQIWLAIDPQGEARTLMGAALTSDAVPEWMRQLGADMPNAWEHFAQAGREYRAGIDNIESAIRILVPRGWSPMNMETEAVREAVRLVECGEGERADNLLAEQWQAPHEWRTRRVCDRVRSMCRLDKELHSLFVQRARLLTLAKAHHENGRYDASIPLLYAQMEGLVMDATDGRKFFTKGAQRANLVDPRNLISIQAGLRALQVIYGVDVSTTQSQGDLSRHGVLHGRELAYDTLINSAKTWSVMDAIVEWAMPKAVDLVAQRRSQRQVNNAGSDGVDERGRRLDDREFAQTRDVLRLLGSSALGWHRQRGAFRDDLVGGVYGPEDFTKRRLPSSPGIHQCVDHGGQRVTYWRTTVSGWVLGLRLSAQDGRFSEQLYSGAEPPVDEDDWPSPWMNPPDWS